MASILAGTESSFVCSVSWSEAGEWGADSALTFSSFCPPSPTNEGLDSRLCESVSSSPGSSSSSSGSIEKC